MNVLELKQALAYYNDDAEIAIIAPSDNAAGWTWSVPCGIAPSGMEPLAIIVCVADYERNENAIVWDHLKKEDFQAIFGEDSQMYPEDDYEGP